MCGAEGKWLLCGVEGKWLLCGAEGRPLSVAEGNGAAARLSTTFCSCNYIFCVNWWVFFKRKLNLDIFSDLKKKYIFAEMIFLFFFFFQKEIKSYRTGAKK